MKLIVIKKTCKKASLVLHALVSATGNAHKFDTGKGQGGGGGRVLHKRTMGEIIVIIRT